jgi:GntR family transcriptional regulator of arabinose operon
MSQTVQHKRGPAKGRRGSKAKRVAESLRKDILTGEYTPGEEMPSQNELAKQYGMSVNTVREAIGLLVHEQLVIRQHGKGTFVAPELPGRQSNIYILMRDDPDSSTPPPDYVVNILRGIMTAVEDRGLTPLLGCSPLKDPQKHQAPPGSVHSGEGVLLVQPRSDKDLYELQNLDIPCVKIDRISPGPAPSVTADRREAARLATQHMIDLGYRNIAHIGVESNHPNQLLRNEGFLDAVRQNGLSLPNGYLQRCPRQFAEIQAAIKQLLKASPRPDALCLSTDRLSGMAVMALSQQGIAVPDDMGIVSFTYSSDPTEQPIPITGIRFPYFEMGRRACDLLAEIIDGQDISNDPVYLPVELVVQESCGAARRKGQ